MLEESDGSFDKYCDGDETEGPIGLFLIDFHRLPDSDQTVNDEEQSGQQSSSHLGHIESDVFLFLQLRIRGGRSPSLSRLLGMSGLSPAFRDARHICRFATKNIISAQEGRRYFRKAANFKWKRKKKDERKGE